MQEWRAPAKPSGADAAVERPDDPGTAEGGGQSREPVPLELQVPIPCDWSSDGFEGIRSIDGDFPECGSPVPSECTSVNPEDVASLETQTPRPVEIAPKRKSSCAEACSPRPGTDEKEAPDPSLPETPDDLDLVASAIPVECEALRGSASARASAKEATRQSWMTQSWMMDGLDTFGLAAVSTTDGGIFTHRQSSEVGKKRWCYSSPLLAFPLIITILSVAASSLAFVALPNTNPLHKDGGSQWWHCALVCSTVWGGLTIVYMGQLLQCFVYKRAGKTMGLKALLAMWFVFSSSLVLSVFLVTGLWMNPAPMNGVIGTMVGLTGASAVVFFCLIPTLSVASAGAEQRSAFDNIKVRGLLVIVFSLLSAVALMTMLIYSSFLTWLDIWYVSIIGITCFKLALCKVFSTLIRFLEKEADIVGANLAMTSTGMCNVISLGGSSSWEFTLALLTVDFLLVAVKVASLASIEVRGFRVSEMLLDPILFFKSAKRQRSIRTVPRMSQGVMKSKYQSLLSKLVAEEIGEVSVPLAYAFCWVVVLAGPNRRAFSGLGTTDFGLKPPDDVPLFLLMSGILVVANFTSFQLLKLALHRWCQIDLEKEVRTLFHEFGGVLIAQTVWVTVTAFCMTMIQCGLDYSLQYGYLSTP